MAGLLLSEYNVLVLDEPGNHLDLDTVEALAAALCEYEGTVIFTSHDRHFLKAVATSIVEVREGRVVAHHGKYDWYLQKVNDEIEAGERELASAKASVPDAVRATKARSVRSEKDVRKEIKAVERTIAQLDEQRRAGGDADAIALQVMEAEERWEELQQELESCAG
jgi:ATP-binding cassette subfamily F protein 3